MVMRLKNKFGGLSGKLARRARPKRKKREKRVVTRKVKLFDGYKPHSKQRELHASKARFLVVCAGRRSGKSYAIAREFVRRVMEDLRASEERGEEWKKPRRLGEDTTPRLHYWIVAPTYALCTAVLREIFKILGGDGGDMIIKWDKGNKRFWIRGGALVELKSAEYPKRLVSVGLDGLLVDEAARIKPEVWRENLSATMGDKTGWGLFISTPLGLNWFYDELWQLTDQTTDPSKRSEEYQGFHFTTADNEAMPHLVEEARKAKRDLPRANYMRNYEASFFAFEGKIYEDFQDTDVHLVDRVPSQFVRKIGVIDWGFANPGCLLTIGITSEDVFYVLDEIHRAGVTVAAAPGAPSDVDSWAQWAVDAARGGVQVFYADPAQPNHIETIRKALRYAGLDAVILGAHNEVNAGIDAVAAMLKPVELEPGYVTPSLFIARHCVELRRELNTYQWDKKKEVPKKVDDHAVDCLRYGVLTEHKLRKRGLSRLRNFAPFAHVQ